MPDDGRDAAETTPRAARARALRRLLNGWGWDADHRLVRGLFLRLLATVYLIAFVSYWVQVEGLVGSGGLLPAEGLIEQARDRLGAERYLAVPSLYWLYPKDVTLHLLCAGGAVCAVLLLAGLFPAAAAGLAWLFYLSLAAVSQDFLSFQWDNLLLEAGFLAIFLAPLRMRPRLLHEGRPSLVVLWLGRWLLFRLMLSSGVAKLTDEAWRDFSALAYHYETQPLPTRLSWHLHQASEGFHELAAATVLFCELVVPFLVFGPRRMRLTACYVLAGYQVMAMATGNYGFLNLLVLALCATLFDDRHLRRFLPRVLERRLGPLDRVPQRPARSRLPALMLAAAILALGIVQTVRVADRRYFPPGPAGTAVRAIQPLRIVNAYSLFAATIPFRREIVIEGSDDGETWKAYAFRWKPGDPARAPRRAAPHQPRLDWQMGLAAFGPHYQAPWFAPFMVRLLQGSPEVLGLLEGSPFADGPPRYVRATLYGYRFTRRGEEAATAWWWVREELAPYYPATSLK